MFIDRLMEKVKKLRDPTVMGLDPKLEYIPASIRKKNLDLYGNTFKAAAESILEFNKRLIDAVSDIIPAIKPQLAYYEMYGTEGIKAFEDTVRYGREKGLLVIADGKRNDIGSTSEAYSKSYLGETLLENDISRPVYNVDALTVNGYLGIDGIKPMIEDCIKYHKGIFVLVKTSNQSSVQLQDMVVEDGRKVYEVIADLVTDWGKNITGKC